MNFKKLQIVYPHVLKVAAFLLISGGLTMLINNIASLHLSPTVEMLIMAVVNIVLASIKKWQDQP